MVFTLCQKRATILITMAMESFISRVFRASTNAGDEKISQNN